LEPPFAADGVQLEAESGLSGVGLECPFDGVPARSGEQSENLRMEIGARSHGGAGGAGGGDEAGADDAGSGVGPSPEFLFEAAEVKW